MGDRIVSLNTHVPGLKQVIQLWDDYGMLNNIRRHSQVVAAVAMLLCGWLEEVGLYLRKDVVLIGALLHDIAKTRCLGSNRRHDLEGQQLLTDLGYSQIGYLIGAHIYLNCGAPLDEVMIVNYADKRVNHEMVVNINQRYTYIANRYGRNNPKHLACIEKARWRCLEIEKIIFRTIFYLHTPDEIASQYKERL